MQSIESAVVERLQAELAQARDRLAELETFSYSVAHDLRAPLRTITCFAQSLQETDAQGMTEQGRHRLDRIVQASRRMDGMIGDILACSLLEHGELRLREVELGARATDVVEELRQSYPRTHVETGVLPRVRCDGVLIRQVLANLVGNAMKFSEQQAAPCVRIDALDALGTTEIRVHDNGAGFDPRYAHRLFGLFQRLHTESEFRGTGVGLAIVKRIVERHGGAVRAQSQPGSCTTFAFTLPR